MSITTGQKRKRDGTHPANGRTPGPQAAAAATATATANPGLAQKRAQLLSKRCQLPIWPQAREIKQALRGSKDVMVLIGETGSGKSTQVPQFLMNEPWCTGCIAVTQPRRVAAMSLAKRVADEVGTPLGSSSPASTVGYSVRFDTSVSPSTKIKFLSEGMLLQEMLRDPCLMQYSAVIVDEVHERSVNVDLILGFLRKMVTGKKNGRHGKPLKVVVMSATADTEALISFFDDGYRDDTVEGDGENGAEKQEEPSDASWSGLSSADDETQSKRHVKIAPNLNGIRPTVHKTSSRSDRIVDCYVSGRQYPVEIVYTPTPVDDFVEAALLTIFQIHYKEPLPGDILVFLTGQDTIESLELLVKEEAAKIGHIADVPKVQVVPLFAALSHAAQQAVFKPAPSFTRKVILATNIAETSVTIPGVRFVVDCGLAKMKEFRSQLGLDSLLVKPISRSAATQRKGRAGREAPGKCYRLYTEQDYLTLPAANEPEILRCDLASSVLNMKARGADDVLNFPLLDPPKRDSLRQAFVQLYRLGCLDDSGKINAIGRRMARLPLAPPLSRVLFAAAADSPDTSTDAAAATTARLLDAIDIISAFSVETIFLPLNTEDKKDAAEAARLELFRREGDHLTLLAAVQAYAAENSDRKAWCEHHFISHRAMRNMMNVRKQLRAQCQQQKLLATSVDMNDNEPRRCNAQQAETLLRCFMAGFAGNTARLMPDGSYRTIEGNQVVAIHPSSVLTGRKLECILYNELVFTTKCYARGVSAVQLQWYAEALGV